MFRCHVKLSERHTGVIDFYFIAFMKMWPPLIKKHLRVLNKPLALS